VKAIAEGHVKDLELRIAEMQAMADTLRHLSACCAGDDLPDCPILADLAGGAGNVGGMNGAAPNRRFRR
jgi:hypothetical protein